MTDLRARMRIYDQARAPDYWTEVELRAATPPQTARPDRGARRALLLVGVVLAMLTVSAAVAVGSGVVEIPWLIESPTPSTQEHASPTPGSLEPTASLLPVGMPGPSADRAGVYGWAARLGYSRGMHLVVDAGSPYDDEFRQTQINFAVENDCFAEGVGPEPVRVTVAGLNGLYLEPYEDASLQFFGGPRDGTTTGAYALAIGDRTLCVYLTWDAATTPDELEAARQVVESIRAQPFAEDGIRINFTLPAGWDTG